MSSSSPTCDWPSISLDVSPTAASRSTTSIQVASLGLVKAVERFEPERGLEFSTFATPTIVGELKRHFRDKGWSVRVPRRVQELHVELNTLIAELTQRLGRSPTIHELAHGARTSDEEVLEAVEAAQAYRSTSIDAPLGGGDDDTRGLANQLGNEDANLFDAENRVVLDGLLAALPLREQLMLRLRFYEGMTQSQIADRLGISQMHVSRLLTKSLRILRERAERQAGAEPRHPISTRQSRRCSRPIVSMSAPMASPRWPPTGQRTRQSTPRRACRTGSAPRPACGSRHRSPR